MKTNEIVKNLLIRAKLRLGDGDDESGEAVGTGNDARVALLNSIGDSADRERGEEFNDVNDDGTTSAFETSPAPEEDPEEVAAREAEATELARIQAEQEAVEQVATPAKIVRKVNGQDMEISDDLLVRAQKIAAADQFLAEAKRLRDEQAGHKAAPVEEVDDLASIARAIQMGTEEEAVAALRKLQVKSPSSDDFSHKIDERLSFNAAYSQFCSEFQDIVSDPRLKKMAEEADIDLINKGDTRPYAERFAQIGKELREWKTGGTAPVAKAEVQNKVERKAAAPVAPKTASSKHVSAVEEETEESASDVISKMAAARGGPQWMSNASR